MYRSCALTIQTPTRSHNAKVMIPVCICMQTIGTSISLCGFDKYVLNDNKCTVIIWRSWVQTPFGSNLGCIVLLSHSYLNQNIYICYCNRLINVSFMCTQPSGWSHSPRSHYGTIFISEHCMLSKVHLRYFQTSNDCLQWKYLQMIPKWGI